MKSKQELIDKWESAIEAAEFYGKGKEERLISYMKDFVSDLNQLDEPETVEQTTRLLESVLKENKRLGKLLEEKHEEWFELMDEINNQETLSEYWIEQKSIDTHVDTLSGEVQVTFRLDDLQNLLVPKQEEKNSELYGKFVEIVQMSPVSAHVLLDTLANLVAKQHAHGTDKQAEVTEKHEMSESEWAEVIDRYKWHLEQEGYVVIEKPTIPQFIADWVEESMNRGYNIRGVFEKAPKIVENWLYFQDDGERIIYLGLAYLLDEYVVEEEPKYIIDTDDIEISDGNHYLTNLTLSKDSVKLPIVGDKFDAIRFDDINQAQAIASYVGGRVEEFEE